MPDSESEPSLLLKYFDSRVAVFEQALIDLRVDFREQSRATHLILDKISDKMEERMSKQSDRMDEQDKGILAISVIQGHHEQFIMSMKWVLGAATTAILGLVVTALQSAFHFGTFATGLSRQLPPGTH